MCLVFAGKQPTYLSWHNMVFRLSRSTHKAEVLDLSEFRCLWLDTMMKARTYSRSTHPEPTMVRKFDIIRLSLGWKAAAIGKQAKNAKAFLEKRYHQDAEIEDAIAVALLTMKEGFEGICP